MSDAETWSEMEEEDYEYEEEDAYEYEEEDAGEGADGSGGGGDGASEDVGVLLSLPSVALVRVERERKRERWGGAIKTSQHPVAHVSCSLCCCPDNRKAQCIRQHCCGLFQEHLLWLEELAMK